MLVHTPPYEKPITDFDWTVRVERTLRRLRIRTIGDLARRTEHELLSMPNFGPTSLVEVERQLHSVGLRLGYIEATHDQHEPVTETYACQRCGRRDGLDAVVTHDVWCKLTGATPAPDGGESAGGQWNLLCLWCMDALAFEMGIRAPVSLHFAGRALYGSSAPDEELKGTTDGK